MERHRQDIRKSIENLFKAYSKGIIGENEFNKAMASLAHLVPKKVQVKGKDGKMFQAIRWINPETGESEKLATKAKVNYSQTDIAQSVTDIILDPTAKSEKLRSLINLGVYDKGLLSLLTDAPLGDAQYYLLKEAGIDVTNLPDISETIKEDIRAEQVTSDTTEGRTENKLLRSIPIEEIWENYEEDLEMVAAGEHKFLLAYGTGGVGKTFTFSQVAKKLKLREYDEEIQPSEDQYDFITIGGKITPTQVYAEMYRHRTKLLVFDDCDSFLATEEVQGFLKRGLDTGEDTKISYKSSRKIYQVDGDPESGVIPTTFRFEGRVIAISNLRAKDIDQAVKSRALCNNLTMTIEETIEKLGSIKNKIDIYTADKKEIISVSQEARDYAFEVLKENKAMLGGDINTRTYSNAVLLANKQFEDGKDKDRVKRRIEGYFSSVTGAFDEKIRESKK
jgi:hypothetical protein